MTTRHFRAVNLAWFVLSAAVIALDQFTKYMAVKTLTLYQAVSVLPFLDFNLTPNTGAAYSFLGQAGGWQRWLFIGIASVISCVIAVWLARLPRKHLGTAIALALILGGALGNLWDRMTLSYVIDFIVLYVKQWALFGAFNVADMAISVGAVLLVLITLFGKEK